MTLEADITRSTTKTTSEITRFLKFSVVGTIGFVIDFGLFNLLAGTLGMGSIPASGISFVVAVTNNFILNRYWTYPDSRSKRISQQAIQFAIVSVLGVGIRFLIFFFFEDMMIRIGATFLQQLPGTLLPQIPVINAITAVRLGQNLTLSLAVVVVLFWNFFVNRIWTYSDAP